MMTLLAAPDYALSVSCGQSLSPDWSRVVCRRYTCGALLTGLHSLKFVIVIRMFRHCLLAALVFLFICCAAGGSASDKDKNTSKATAHVPRPRPIHLDLEGRKWADKTLRRMSTEEKVGQLFMIWAKVQFMNDADPIWVELRDKVQKYHIGSLGVTVPTD